MSVYGLLYPLVMLLAHHLPPYIHPMIVHFPIVLLYLTAGVDILVFVLPDRDRFLQRAGFYLLTLACIATIITMLFGLVSEQWVHWTPAMVKILSIHQHFAVLTGLAEGSAWLVRLATRFPAAERSGWSLPGRRGRASWASTLLVVAAAVLISVTGYYGGHMVYHYGAGVLGVTRKPIPGPAA